MAFSGLHDDCIQFAQGMPAIAISWQRIGKDVNAFLKTLAGTNPGKPAPSMGDIPMPLYKLAYSAFVTKLTVQRSGNTALLDVELIANVHPSGMPDKVIYSYTVKTTNPAVLTLDFDKALNEVFWRQQGNVVPDITGNFDVNADAALALTTIPDPKRDNYVKDVDVPIKWLTAQSFIGLVTTALPRYSLGELVPWLTFLEPLRIKVTAAHILITSARAQMKVGLCNPVDVIIEPDPAFPYGATIPNPSVSVVSDFALYVPKTRLFEFFAKEIEPAVLVSSSGGGLIKWSLAGSIGLRKITLDIHSATGISGVLGIEASVDFVGAARAWVDGPSGMKLGLASASVLGSGDFSGDVKIDVDLPTATIEAELQITKADLPNVSWDVNTPLGWPIDDVAGEILNQVAKNEIKKLVGQVKKLGRWSVMTLPWKYIETLPAGTTPKTACEGLKNVSGLFLIAENIGFEG